MRKQKRELHVCQKKSSENWKKSGDFMKKIYDASGPIFSSRTRHLRAIDLQISPCAKLDLMQRALINVNPQEWRNSHPFKLPLFAKSAAHALKFTVSVSLKFMLFLLQSQHCKSRSQLAHFLRIFAHRLPEGVYIPTKSTFFSGLHTSRVNERS